MVGVHNMWKAIRHAEESILLSTLAKNMKLEAEQNGQSCTTPCYGIHVNASINTCVRISSTQPANTHWQRHGGAIYIFPQVILAFARARATLVFVFDGPHRPIVNEDAGYQRLECPWWAGTVRELILALGFTVHYAPGEATAELAMLNQAGIIDAVVSTDDDALIFGARRLIGFNMRQFINGTTQDDVEVRHYTSARIHQNAGITAGGLVLFALLSGGGYRYEDLQQLCEFNVALALSQSGYGDELINAANIYLFNSHPNHDGFDIFVNQWRSRICNKLTTNHRNHFKECRPDIAQKIRDSDLPKSEVLLYFLRPVNSATLHEWCFPNPSGWYLFHEPSLLRVKVFCQDKLQWADDGTLKKRFVKHVLPTIVIRMLYSPLAIYNVEEAKLATPLHQVTIQNFRWTKRRLRGHAQVRRARMSLLITNLLDVSGLPKIGNERIIIWAPRDGIPIGLEETA